MHATVNKSSETSRWQVQALFLAFDDWMIQWSNSKRRSRGGTTAARLPSSAVRHCNGTSIDCDRGIFASRKGTKAQGGVRLKPGNDYPAYSGPNYRHIAPSRSSVG